MVRSAGHGRSAHSAVAWHSMSHAVFVICRPIELKLTRVTAQRQNPDTSFDPARGGLFIELSQGNSGPQPTGGSMVTEARRCEADIRARVGRGPIRTESEHAVPDR